MTIFTSSIPSRVPSFHAAGSNCNASTANASRRNTVRASAIFFSSRPVLLSLSIAALTPNSAAEHRDRLVFKEAITLQKTTMTPSWVFDSFTHSLLPTLMAPFSSSIPLLRTWPALVGVLLLAAIGTSFNRKSEKLCSREFLSSCPIFELASATSLSKMENATSTLSSGLKDGVPAWLKKPINADILTLSPHKSLRASKDPSSMALLILSTAAA
mmetsp:Transcript_14869/g.37802  ORF Transcript_14869/g.37802 Transcript_14869/m.37802 type:complete len:214 (-) Transcript_14869:258-899(-)